MNYTQSRLNPLRGLEELQSRIINAFRPLSGTDDGDEPFAHSGWSPLVDIAEGEAGYLIVAEIPGMKKDEVKVTVENGILSISGERKFQQDGSMRWQRTERGYGRFSRSFTLPQYADPVQVKAEFKEGLLHIHVPKSEAARPKQIDIKVN
jgi:HSP20 family protein